MVAPTKKRSKNVTWEDMYNEFDPSELIRVLRTRRGWSQVELSKKIGVDPYVISLWESGKKPIVRIEVIYKLAAAFSVPVGLFFGPAWGENASDADDPEFKSVFAGLPREHRDRVVDYANVLSTAPV